MLALDRVREGLGRVERGRPKLDAAMEQRKRALDNVLDALSVVRRQIAAIVRESERAEELLRLDQRRLLVAGRISYFLESAEMGRNADKKSEIEDLLHDIADLEEELSVEAVRERTDAARLLVSQLATKILEQLPFDGRYRSSPVDINFNDLTIGFVVPGRRIPMRNISGDKNYLSLHLALFWALHRYLAKSMQRFPGYWCSIRLVDPSSRSVSRSTMMTLLWLHSI